MAWNLDNAAETACSLKTAIDDVTRMFVLQVEKTNFNKDDILAAAQRLISKVKAHQQLDALAYKAYQTGDTPEDPIIVDSDDNSMNNGDGN
ncbi:hypothetical protein FQN55_007795 [Onygenales sp. PD_40]|nr:hypothetical protein FQN55_007795 [Onygenales sp. PD_40]KAK2792485.1 hypothetical protein FQN52_003420 [Onygenales sp. PD_12]KAK2805165.1 hypothetical protein FQN51_000688 [Onygenales sp. PD_10]